MGTRCWVAGRSGDCRRMVAIAFAVLIIAVAASGCGGSGALADGEVPIAEVHRDDPRGVIIGVFQEWGGGSGTSRDRVQPDEAQRQRAITALTETSSRGPPQQLVYTALAAAHALLLRCRLPSPAFPDPTMGSTGPFADLRTLFTESPLSELDRGGIFVATAAPGVPDVTTLFAVVLQAAIAADCHRNHSGSLERIGLREMVGIALAERAASSELLTDGESRLFFTWLDRACPVAPTVTEDTPVAAVHALLESPPGEMLVILSEARFPEGYELGIPEGPIPGWAQICASGSRRAPPTGHFPQGAYSGLHFALQQEGMLWRIVRIDGPNWLWSTDPVHVPADLTGTSASCPERPDISMVALL